MIRAAFQKKYNEQQRNKYEQENFHHRTARPLINYWNETSDTISPKRNIPLAGEGERNGVWGWIKGLSYEPNWACEQWLPCGWNLLRILSHLLKEAGGSLFICTFSLLGSLLHQLWKHSIRRLLHTCQPICVYCRIHNHDDFVIGGKDGASREQSSSLELLRHSPYSLPSAAKIQKNIRNNHSIQKLMFN